MDKDFKFQFDVLMALKELDGIASTREIRLSGLVGVKCPTTLYAKLIRLVERGVIVKLIYPKRRPVFTLPDGHPFLNS